jgi:hypothetical protein
VKTRQQQVSKDIFSQFSVIFRSRREEKRFSSPQAAQNKYSVNPRVTARKRALFLRSGQLHKKAKPARRKVALNHHHDLIFQ